ncbi:MAG: PQQ-like beta-propeller repeat protein [Phycisphaerae bacterium]|nr:PQQ-like beta-propeller repeat protein [Phycisphaerae bacterium]
MKTAWMAGLILLAGVVASPLPAAAGDWPHWRGPNHDGISSETGFATTWTEPPKIIWDKPIGAAFSSFACVGDKVFTCGTKERKQVLYCLDAGTGDVVWQKAFESERKDGQGGDGTRATPTFDGGRIYIVGGHGLVLCFDAAKGDEIWRYKGNNEPQWGYSNSVLIEGNLAVVTPGNADGGLLALDKMTGKTVWKCGDEQAGYATPYPFTFEDKRYIVGFMGKCVIIADAKTGKQVWKTPWKTSYDVNASSPIFHDGHLFLTSGYGTGCALFKMAAAGDKLEGKEVWRNKNIVNKFQSCVLRDGVLYGGDEKSLKAVDFKTGKILWDVRERTANSTVLLADDQLIVLTESGKLMIAPVSPKEFKPTATASILDGRCWTIPALHQGKLFARNLKKAVCVDLSRK